MASGALSPRFIRFIKLTSYVGSGMVGFHMIFRADYSPITGDAEHCFTGVSRAIAFNLVRKPTHDFDSLNFANAQLGRGP
jgi:hypothetical protein